MEGYKIYTVLTAKIKPGKEGDAAIWFRDKAKPQLEACPGIKEVKAYSVQFLCGPEYGFELWLERESWAALDWDHDDVVKNPQKYSSWKETPDLFEWGPGRLVGEWPGSYFVTYKHIV